MRTTWRRLALPVLLVLCGFLTMCHHDHDEHGPKQSGGGNGTHSLAPESTSGVTNADRIAAMLSIHANAYWPHRDLPAEIQAIPLDNAIAVLKRDEGKRAISRRRRAVGKLAGYGIEQPEFRDAIARLGANPDKIEAALADQTRLQGAKFSENAAARESFVNDLIAPQFDPPCTWTKLHYDVWSSDPGLSVETKISVNVGIDEVAKAIDPQSWDVCSKFWAPPPTGAYLSDPQQNPVNPEPIGSEYGGTHGKQLLFERFQCPVSGCVSEFTNLLTVSTVWEKTTPSAYRVTYGLEKALSGRVLSRQGDTLITTDDGYVRAEDDGNGNTIVTVTKNLAYSEPALNGIAQGVLQASEVGSEFAELVCCPVDTK